MKKLISIISIVAILAAMMTPAAFAETVTKTDIIYSQTFDEGTYTVDYNEGRTEMYLYNDGKKIMTFAKNSGSFAEDDTFGSDIITNMAQGRLTTGALGGTIEAYYNFPESITTGTVTVDISYKTVYSDSKNTQKIYFAAIEEPVTTVDGTLSGDGYKSGYNNNENRIVSMFINHSSKYLRLSNQYSSASSKNNVPKSGNGKEISSSIDYDFRLTLNTDEKKQNLEYKQASATDYTKISSSDVNWYANGSSGSFSMADNKVAGFMFNESTTAALDIDSIVVTHTYEEEVEVTEPKEEVENLTITADGTVASSAVFNWNTGDAATKSARIVTAVYNDQGALVAVKSGTATVSEAVPTADLSTEAIAIPGDAELIKVFVWDF